MRSFVNDPWQSTGEAILLEFCPLILGGGCCYRRAKLIVSMEGRLVLSESFLMLRIIYIFMAWLTNLVFH